MATNKILFFVLFLSMFNISFAEPCAIPVDEEVAAKLFKLLDALDDNDDVQEISGNYDMSDEVMEKLGG